MPGSLEGQVAVVTGASSGIGAATAVALADAGASVVAVARRAERLEKLVGEIESRGGVAVAFPGDVTREDVAGNAIAQAVNRFGRLDILVNSAGTIQAANLENADFQQWRDVVDINLMASIYTCHAAIAPMKAQGSGYIINVGSLGCRTTSPVFNSYSTSKFGLNAMTDGLRQEVGPYGIRVCLLVPGTVSTEISENITEPAYRDAIREHLNQDGALKPEDLAVMIPFIVSMPRRVDVSELWVRATTDTQY